MRRKGCQPALVGGARKGRQAAFLIVENRAQIIVADNVRVRVRDRSDSNVDCVCVYMLVVVSLEGVRLCVCKCIFFHICWCGVCFGVVCVVCVCVRVCVHAVEFAPHSHSEQVVLIIDLPSRAFHYRSLFHDGSRCVLGAGCLSVLCVVSWLSQTKTLQHSVSRRLCT